MTFDEQAEFLMQSIVSHDRQIGENAAHIRELKEAIASLVRVTNQDAVDIQALARIAESHEQRISKIEETR
jgi:4-hydroxy-3-methylbut-2-en-1-yl diphosphate synthase IspG/GcpE